MPLKEKIWFRQASLPAKDGRIRRMKDIFQDPNYKRHDNFGYNFRMPDVAVALGLSNRKLTILLIKD